MADKLFKKSMFGGYKKSEVNAQAAAWEAKNTENEEKIASLTAELEALREEVKELEKERAFISDALLNAKKEGERMLAETNAKIAELQTAAEAELARLQALAEEERERIRAYQKSAGEALKAHKERVDSISI